jgi:hypothetical protein
MIAPTQFETDIRKLTEPINGQYPRPWMTKMTHPENAQVFIVGHNQAKTFRVQDTGSHDKFIDAHFNRNGMGCRQLYDLINEDASVTRRNIDRLTELLERKGVTNILETNVICYSTPMGADMAKSEHEGGLEAGTKLFETLLDHINPDILIIFGSNTRTKLGKLFEDKLSVAAEEHDDVVVCNPKRGGYSPALFPIRSLAIPGYNQWHSWAWQHLELVTNAVSEMVKLIQKEKT